MSSSRRPVGLLDFDWNHCDCVILLRFHSSIDVQRSNIKPLARIAALLNYFSSRYIERKKSMPIRSRHNSCCGLIAA